jgi:hypothetical protein
MIVEGVIVQGWIGENDVFYFPKMFKVLHGFEYDKMDYYKDSNGAKVGFVIIGV